MVKYISVFTVVVVALAAWAYNHWYHSNPWGAEIYTCSDQVADWDNDYPLERQPSSYSGTVTLGLDHGPWLSAGNHSLGQHHFHSTIVSHLESLHWSQFQGDMCKTKWLTSSTEEAFGKLKSGSLLVSN